MRWYVKPEILELASQAGTCFSLKKERYHGNVVSMSARCEEYVQLSSERRCGEKAGHQVLKDGVWVDYVIVARELIVEGGWKQKRWYDIGLSDGKVCKGCEEEEGTEKHRLYHCLTWKEVRDQISKKKKNATVRTERQNIKERMEKIIFNGQEVGIRDVQKMEIRSRKPSGTQCDGWLTARTAGMACVRWSVVQLDHEELEPMREYFGPIEAGIEVQRTINRADMTALCVVLSGLHRGEKKCNGPKSKEADLWIKIVGSNREGSR